MSLPVILHSGLAGAPTLNANTNGSMNALLLACLVNGFNSKTVTSATAASGVVTFNFASAPGFPVGFTVDIAGATNASVNIKTRVTVASGNAVSVAIPGVPDGAVGGTITMKFAALGWTRPYSSGTTTYAFQQGGAAAHKRFLRVYDATLSTTQSFYARAYESMTAISTGTGPFPTTAEKTGNGSEVYIGSTASRPWYLVGTPRFFYFVMDYGSDYSAIVPPVFSTAVSPTLTGFYFGELDRVQKAGDTYAYIITQDYQGLTLYGSRASTLAANSRPAMTINGPYAENYFNGKSTYPDPVSGNIIVHDAAKVYEGFNGKWGLRGFFPGMLCHDATMVRATPVWPAVGTVYTGFAGVTGRVLLMGSGLSEYMLRLDEDWGDL